MPRLETESAPPFGHDIWRVLAEVGVGVDQKKSFSLEWVIHMDNDLTEIFNVLNRARTILLLPSSYPTREEVAALAMLGRTLEHNQKTATLLLPPALTFSLSAPLGWPSGLKEELTAGEEVTIALDTERHPVHALRYEQEGGFLRIYLRADRPFPQPENFTISAADTERFESTVVIGAPSIDLIPKRSELEPALTNGILINIDTDPANEGFGDFNLIASAETLPTTIQQLIMLFPLMPPDLEQWKTELVTPVLSLSELHILGRMLARLTEEQGVWTSTLAENDFERSGLSREAFIETLPRLPLKHALFPKPYGVLWNAGGVMQCSVVGAHKRFYARLSKRISGTYGFEGYRFTIETESGERARLRLVELLS